MADVHLFPESATRGHEIRELLAEASASLQEQGVPAAEADAAIRRMHESYKRFVAPVQVRVRTFGQVAIPAELHQAAVDGVVTALTPRFMYELAQAELRALLATRA